MHERRPVSGTATITEIQQPLFLVGEYAEKAAYGEFAEKI
jgi:hypothetical protein